MVIVIVIPQKFLKKSGFIFNLDPIHSPVPVISIRKPIVPIIMQLKKAMFRDDKATPIRTINNRFFLLYNMRNCQF